MVSHNFSSNAECVLVDLYDPHSWDGPEYYYLRTEQKTYKLNYRSKYEKSSYARIFLICDEFTSTRLPFFFPRDRRIALLKESPIHTNAIDPVLLARRFDLVLTFQDDLVRQGAPFQRLDFSTNWVMADLTTGSSFNKSKMCSFLGNINHPARQGYRLRHEVARLVMTRSDIDCFGRGIREIESKVEGLADYRFSVAMENCRKNYYFTEKIIDCFFTETVPIYWGCPKIYEIFDSRGFIVFESLEDLCKILDALDEEKYQIMLPYVRANKRRCIELKYDSFESYLVRCLNMVENCLSIPRGSVSYWEVSKIFAGLRFFGDRINYLRTEVVNK